MNSYRKHHTTILINSLIIFFSWININCINSHASPSDDDIKSPAPAPTLVKKTRPPLSYLVYSLPMSINGNEQPRKSDARDVKCNCDGSTKLLHLHDQKSIVAEKKTKDRRVVDEKENAMPVTSILNDETSPPSSDREFEFKVPLTVKTDNNNSPTPLISPQSQGAFAVYEDPE